MPQNLDIYREAYFGKGCCSFIISDTSAISEGIKYTGLWRIRDRKMKYVCHVGADGHGIEVGECRRLVKNGKRP